MSAVSSAVAASPVVSNVAFVQQPDGAGSTEVVVSYDLATPDGPTTTTLFYSLDAAPFVPAITVSGHVGPGQTTGTLSIDWAVATDLAGRQSNNLVVRVVAEDGLPIPVIISGTIGDGDVTTSGTQTLTFTFAEPVVGFDADDVVTTNATGGAFTGSGATYSLAVTANSDGPVSVLVPAGVAASASGSGNGNAASNVFSFEFDRTGPTLAGVFPDRGAIVTSLSAIDVGFADFIIGLSPEQLTVNGSPATNVVGRNPYRFTGFADPGDGLITVVLAPGSTTDLLGNPFAGDSWTYVNELLDFVSVPAGTFTMGRSDSGDDGLFASAAELPRHEVTLSAYDIGRYEVTNAEFVTVMNWALGRGYLANDTAGTPYAGAGSVYLLAPDSTAARRMLFDIHPGNTFSQIAWTGSAFATRTRDGVNTANHPVLCVTWYGAAAFCNFMAEMVGKPLAYDLSTWTLNDADPTTEGLQFVASYRLPTEAEWERAAGWDGTRRWTYSIVSDTLTGRDRANYNMGSNNWVSPQVLFAPRTSPVGWFNGINISPNGNVATVDSPSPVGAYDMTGNVAEWCHDVYAVYTATAKTNPTGAEGAGPFRSVRGGSWNSLAVEARSARRLLETPGTRNFQIGFRVAAVR